MDRIIRSRVLLRFTKRPLVELAPTFAVVAAVTVALMCKPCLAVDGDFWEPWSFSGDDVNGVWRPPVELPTGPKLFGVHAALLYDGAKTKLVLFRNEMLVIDLSATVETIHDLDLDGTSNNQNWIPNGHEPFCSGYVALGGKLLVMGNDLWQRWPSPHEPQLETWASLFDPVDPVDTTDPLDNWLDAGPIPPASGMDNPVCATAEWSIARYYPTVTLLPSGRALVCAGDFWTDCQPDHKVGTTSDEYDQQERWLIYDPPTNRWVVDTDPDGFGNPVNAGMVPYPHIKVLPHGLFWHGDDGGNGGIASRLWTPFDAWDDVPSPTPLLHTKGSNRLQGACVVLTLDARSSDAKILMVGGGPEGSTAKLGQGAEWITYRHTPGAVPAVSGLSGWSETGAMQSTLGRRHVNAVLLPNGEVLAIGGEETKLLLNYSCEIFSPSLNNWRTVDGIDRMRGHHSTALLLPDGRVVSTGHENNFEDQTEEVDNSYQLYYPPYLFSGTGWATRPVIQSVDTPSSVIHYGLPFEITVAGSAADIDEVVLMRPGAPTHGADFSQGRVLLSHTTVSGEPGKLVVSGPKDSLYAPPANYMLVVLDGGVPSVAKWVTVEGVGSYTISSGQTVRWGADVWLDRDFTVLAGGKLEILPGTNVHVAKQDRVNQAGGDADRVEIIIQGQLLAEGTPLLPIVFESDDGPGSGSFNWLGMRFDLTGVTRTGYGYLGANEPISKLDYVTIEDAQVGIQIENQVAPAIANLTVTSPGTIPGSESDPAPAGIYVKGTDVEMPLGWWRDTGTQGSQNCAVTPCWEDDPAHWSLGTNALTVTLSNSVTPSKDFGNGEPLKADLFVRARWPRRGRRS